MGKHSGKVNSGITHWLTCWMAHSACFWNYCIELGVKGDTTAEYQAFNLYRDLLLRKGGDK